MTTHLHYTLILLISFGITLSSCRKKELPVSKPENGDITTSIVGLGSNYSKIVYFDLGTNSHVGESIKLNWDLAFSCATDMVYITLNGAKLMHAVNVTDQTFEQVNSITTLSANGKVDHPSGRIDSLAIQGTGVYLINKGMNFDGDDLGNFKMEIIEHNATSFTGRFANIDGSNEQTITIQKDQNYNFVYMNWHQNSAITTPTIEPLKNSWDIVFTQYSEIFYEPDYMPYLVLGTLTNRHQTKAVLTQGITFEEINFEKAQELILSSDINAIGYDWKSFQFDVNLYVVNFEKVYVIQDQEGYLYKLRFVDFYNTTGEKGNPTFEFQRL